jgi:hypothetical protein
LDDLSNFLSRTIERKAEYDLSSDRFDLRAARERGNLLNYGLQMRVFRCNCGVSNTNKTNENRSVRTGQIGLANRRLKTLGNRSEPACPALRATTQVIHS